jgi:hypothetical protein
MKKKIIIFFICLLVLSLGYVYYKSFLLFNFKVEINDELEAKLKDSTETITIKQNVYDENNDYTEYDNVISFPLEPCFIKWRPESFRLMEKRRLWSLSRSSIEIRRQ